MERRAAWPKTIGESGMLLVTVVIIGILVWVDPARPQGHSIHESQQPVEASKKIEGQLVEIRGSYYVVKNEEGKEIYLLISQDTNLGDAVTIGDHIAVWTSPIEHAIAIRASVLEGERAAVDTATRSIKGELVTIEGKYYVMRDSEGKQIRLLVTEDTELAGAFVPGDQIEVFTAPVEHAVAIRAAK